MSSAASQPQPPSPDLGSGLINGKIKKRVIVCCDGTWQDGIIVKERWKYTNILRLSRIIHHEDRRFEPPIPQIVFYQSGIGSENNFYSEYVQGATGASLGEKVQEGYGYISQNYQPGDEIFLFGFSRGAYTARMIAAFIGAIGVLDRKDMDNFAEVFVNFQKRGKTNDKAEIAKLDAMLAPWTHHDSPGKRRADSDDDSFSVKCVGVFDTVGSLGLPEELTLHSSKMTIFGFPDKKLGEHIENAFHALALNETRADFDCAKFEQTEGGRLKKQLLKQCWFRGSHSDIGGGWHDHDLADLTLAWMAANVDNILALDYKHLATLPDPCYPWGDQPPHDPTTGIFTMAHTITRQLPTITDDVTHETVHPSVAKHIDLPPQLKMNLEKNPALICELLPLEIQAKEKWPYIPGTNLPQDVKITGNPGDGLSKSFLSMALAKGKELSQHALHGLTHREIMKNASGEPVYEKNQLARHVDETPFGSLVGEWTDKN